LKRRKSDPDNPYLFPSYGMKHRPLGLITKHWVSRCRDAGFEMDLHVNRHLVAKLVLDRDPTAMSLVQEILGHKSEDTTRAYYADVNKALVQKKFQAHLEEVERALSNELMVSFRRTEQ
jgi:integrase